MRLMDLLPNSAVTPCRMQKFLLFSAMTGVLYFTGCSSTPDRHERHEQTAPPLPAMGGEETFADGKLLVEASLSQGTGPFGRRGEGGGAGGGGRRGGRRHSGGEGGGGGYGERPERSGGGEGEERSEEVQPRLHESTMPPVVLQLRATNKGGEPLDITWIECNSALGNFGVLPEKMSLPAGETARTDRMTSLLGISGDEVPVTVTLRVLGKQEKKTFVLHPIPTEVKS